MSFIDDNDRKTRQFLGLLYKSFFDAREENSKNKTIEIELGAVDDALSSKNSKILEELRDKGVLSAIDVRNEAYSKVDTYSWEVDGVDFDSASDEYLSIATCDIDEQQLKSVFKEYSFYPKYFLRRYKTREIVINDQYLLSRPDSWSPSDEFIQFLYRRPYAKHPYKAILAYVDNETGKKNNKKLFNFLQDLNFVGEIKKLFFSEASSRAVCLRPVIMNADYRQFLINEDELNSQLLSLPTI